LTRPVYKLLFLTLLALALSGIFFLREKKETPDSFINVRGTRFYRGEKELSFVGANASFMYGKEAREKMPQSIKELSQLGVRVVRVWAFKEGGERGDDVYRVSPSDWNEAAFEHLDRVIVEAGRNQMFVQICLTNWWRDTGGVVQYLNWAGINSANDNLPFGIDTEQAMLFYTNRKTIDLYKEHVRRIVLRRNSITGGLYRDDPTIFAYELMNEAQSAAGRFKERRRWIEEMSGFIKSMDPNHLVTPGVWGYRYTWEASEWLLDHKIKTIDFCDVHHYPKDDTDVFVNSPERFRSFIAHRASLAASINRPLVVGEFGMERDGYESVSQKDWYSGFFRSSFSAGVRGASFWIYTLDTSDRYGITPFHMDQQLREEIRSSSSLLNRRQPEPQRITSIVPQQFPYRNPVHRPVVEGNVFRFAAEQAINGAFERVGSGKDYLWGMGAGFFDYRIPERTISKVNQILVRANLRPVPPVGAKQVVTKVRLTINGRDCGRRVIEQRVGEIDSPVEWKVSTLPTLMDASLGLPLTLRFSVDTDLPYGLNISKYNLYATKDRGAVEVVIN
jgi:mannan endo-1,4-beta-mannosidase